MQILNFGDQIMFVEIFGRMTCPYCVRAVELAKKMQTELKDFDFKFVDMIENNISKEDLEPRVGKPVATVPQIFIDDKPIGGCSDFQELVAKQFNITL